MRLSDALKQRRGDLIDRLEKLAKLAETESRLFTGDEQHGWDAGQAELKDLDLKLKSQLEAEELLRGSPAQPVAGNGPRLIAEDGTVLRALRREDKLVDLLPRGVQREQVSIGTVLRGIIHGQWKGMKPIERAVGETGDSVFPVPASISNDWLDRARAASVAFQAGAITIPMRTLTERIIGVTTDPVFTFRKEHKPIPESDIVLGPIDLKARLCGAIVRTSIELIEDSPIANELIERVLLNAAAAMMDWAMLAGDGSQIGDLDNPTGLLNWPGVNAIPWPGTVPFNYDPAIDAYGEVLIANGVPTAMISNPYFSVMLAKMKSGLPGDQTKLETPEPIAGLPRFVTPVMPTGKVVLGDFSMLAWGMRTGMTIEATRVGGDGTFSKAQVLIRLYFRGDTAVLRPKWFSKMTFTGANPAEAAPQTPRDRGGK